MNAEEGALFAAIRGVLADSDDLRGEPFRGSDRPGAGLCFPAVEAMFHALGGSTAGYAIRAAAWRGTVHYWLETRAGEVIDPTFDQFDELPDYAGAHPLRVKGLHDAPNPRAAELLRRIGRRSLPGS